MEEEGMADEQVGPMPMDIVGADALHEDEPDDAWQVGGAKWHAPNTVAMAAPARSIVDLCLLSQVSADVKLLPR